MSPASHDSLADYLHAIVAALPSSSPYCLIGALAVNAWGRLRATNDIDLLVLADVPARTQLIEALRAHEFQIDETWLEHNPMAKDVVMRLTHRSYPTIPLDLLFANDRQSQSALARRQALQLLGVSLYVCSPEDLILLKLKAGRPHDFEDVLGIIKNPHLHVDLDYLWSWADQLGLQGELSYVLHAADTGR
jgi:predicted nucleotidyltransferase